MLSKKILLFNEIFRASPRCVRSDENSKIWPLFREALASYWEGERWPSDNTELITLKLLLIKVSYFD